MSLIEPTPTPSARPVDAGPRAAPRRTELAAFLKARRGRVTPEDVGMPPGLRRRTPGLRREEVAQLSGVGVTWYTWLEQGRPINASEQVLGAIARTLKLDTVERAHLYRLAGHEPGRPPAIECPFPEELQTVLDALDPLPTAVSNSRYDILRWNSAYEALFPGLMLGEKSRRNSMWATATTPACCNAFLNRDQELPRMVAVLRSGYGQHLGEPYWEEFIRDLLAASPEFARLWAQQDVAAHSARQKVFRHAAVGEVRLTATNLGVTGVPEARMVVYSPMDQQSRDRIAWLMDHPGLPVVDHTH
ncbi:helix-turn-helix transcriptional regulator [Streptacidiphilus cavernicola]|uniref:Helix-turn-helix transcriptional regulator n=1 Tax=Streptacidiphilus cavernicola TaxID=3342716 RepID=A0ABV6VRU5_9ACTN